MNHVKVSIYINEADKWQHRPLHLELLSMLDKAEIASGMVLRAVAGFTLKNPVVSASLVDIGSKLPLVVQFIDTMDKVDAILPKVKEMVGNRLIIREPVEVVNGMCPDFLSPDNT
ncbi:DUF190 domain-containing protein [Fluoribacter gormanii]|uniref:Uncharacterized ACR, COG1993 n=1 Tax=Fluoribacter gormanii TaxID=464 RepID=A0A377GGE0_9GAMM|nr:DUF190 domain-containing protein [Fluoribacter gormanii]KTD05270.1 hypothetical protein Lgor_0484 [Fluoribacter gormanii]MCW8470039.1 DUF190 domain-containing protein [Fluoribacter gormanii]SIR70472.1 hypothetical protein SAMN05421777_12032 [Fluoribacter gormanii]STO23605.1 Uncharacterized ACR, COG1993 [Fluoribacter gormanii]